MNALPRVDIGMTVASLRELASPGYGPPLCASRHLHPRGIDLESWTCPTPMRGGGRFDGRL